MTLRAILVYATIIHVSTSGHASTFYKNLEKNDMDLKINKEDISFTTTQLARSCGVSRATILRYETADLLHPTHKDADGTRYYDFVSYEILQNILRLQDFGFTLKKIHEIFEHKNYEEWLSELERKVFSLQTSIMNIRNQVYRSEIVEAHADFHPSIHVYTKEVYTENDYQMLLEETGKAMLEVTGSGHAISRFSPVGIICHRSDWLHKKRVPGTYKYTIYVPVDSKSVGENIIDIPRSDGYSLYWRGDIMKSGPVFSHLSDMLESHNQNDLGYFYFEVMPHMYIENSTNLAFEFSRFYVPTYEYKMD